jgi:hypothetical protein
MAARAMTSCKTIPGKNLWAKLMAFFCPQKTGAVKMQYIFFFLSIRDGFFFVQAISDATQWPHHFQ